MVFTRGKYLCTRGIGYYPHARVFTEVFTFKFFFPTLLFVVDNHIPLFPFHPPFLVCSLPKTLDVTPSWCPWRWHPPCPSISLPLSRLLLNSPSSFPSSKEVLLSFDRESVPHHFSFPTPLSLSLLSLSLTFTTFETLTFYPFSKNIPSSKHYHSKDTNTFWQ